MKVLIHDLSEKIINKLNLPKDIIIIDTKQKYSHCVGCFKCWTKHPTQYFIKDYLKNIGTILGKSEEIVIISQNCYGSYSPKIKNVLDRAISMSNPMSTYRHKEMHHCRRYKQPSKLRVFVYGEINNNEKITFNELVKRNEINFGCNESSIYFLKDNNMEDEIKI